MARKKIHEMSYEELELHEKQLELELNKVRNRKNQYKKLKFNTDLLTGTSSQASNQ